MTDPSRKDTYAKMKRDDERRWNAADIDFDNKLNLEEYSAFLHPQDYPRMRSVVIEVNNFAIVSIIFSRSKKEWREMNMYVVSSKNIQDSKV